MRRSLSRPRLECTAWATIFTVLVAIPAGFAENADTAGGRQDWSIITENDSYLPVSDRYYTNGLQLSWVPRPIARANAGPLEIAIDNLLLGASPVLRNGFFFGQAIFTPVDLTKADPDPRDRPYAGWLYLGTNFYGETDNELTNLRLTLGLVGPDVQGAFVQNEWHRAFHWLVQGVQAQGWRHQIHNEPGLVVAWQRQWRYLAGSSIQYGLVPEVTVAAGNIYDYGAIGGRIEVGDHLRTDWGPVRVAPGSAGTDFIDRQALGDGAFGIKAFGGFESRFVPHNIFLDGNNFQQSASARKLPIVSDLNFGLSVTGYFGRISATATWRGKEFDTQTRSQRFVSLSFTR